MMQITIGYPDHEAEVRIIRNRNAGASVDRLRPVLNVQTVSEMIGVAREVHVAPTIYDYAVTICAATRRMPELRLGVSPRGSLALITAGQTLAAASGRTFVTADDVKQLMPYVLGHRMLITAEAELQGATAESLLKQVVAAVPVPEARVGVSA